MSNGEQIVGYVVTRDGNDLEVERVRETADGPVVGDGSKFSGRVSSGGDVVGVIPAPAGTTDGDERVAVELGDPSEGA